MPRAFAHAVVAASQERRLATHEGYDIGAARVARRLVNSLERRGVPVAGPVLGGITRLLVDLNRSPGHPRVFGAFGRELERSEKESLMLDHYLPHQQRVRAELLRLVERGGRVLHLAVHSFTPVLGKQRRNADLGLLYDPGRPPELAVSRALSRAVSERSDELRIRSNYPYRGTSDGLTTALRRELPASRYAGIELELNQRHVVRPGSALERILVVATTELASQQQ